MMILAEDYYGYYLSIVEKIWVFVPFSMLLIRKWTKYRDWSSNPLTDVTVHHIGYNAIGTIYLSIYLSINIIIFTPWEFFTSALTYGFQLKFEWQQVSSSLQDSSQYFGRSPPCCSLDSLLPSRYFKVFQSWYQSFDECTKSTNYNWYNRHFHVPQFFFQFPSKVQVLISLFCILSILLCCPPEQQSPQSCKFSLFCWL